MADETTYEEVDELAFLDDMIGSEDSAPSQEPETDTSADDQAAEPPATDEQPAEDASASVQATDEQPFDWASFDVSKVPQNILSNHPGFRGISKELAREREQAREIQRRYEELLHQQAAGRQNKEQGDDDDLDVDPDEFLTRAQFEKLAEKQMAQVAERQFQQYHQQQTRVERDRLVAQSENDIREQSKALPVNLQYDAVVNESTAAYLRSNPQLSAMTDAILANHSNPAKALYSLIVENHPDFNRLYQGYMQQVYAGQSNAQATAPNPKPNNTPARQQGRPQTPGEMIDADLDDPFEFASMLIDQANEE